MAKKKQQKQKQHHKPKTSKALVKTKGGEVSFFSKIQQSLLREPTPKDCIYFRPGRGGIEFQYVTIGYVVEKLDQVCLQHGMIWSFETEEVVTELIPKTGHIVVKGRLKLIDGNGNVVRIIEQYGSAEVKFPRSGGKIPIDLGDDFKAAGSDALKKCSSLMGVARDVYFKDWDVLSKVGKKPEPSTVKKNGKSKGKDEAILTDAEVVDPELVTARKDLHTEMKKLLKTRDAIIAVLKDTIGKGSFMELTLAEIKKLRKSIKNG